jgi:hypothetical protein
MSHTYITLKTAKLAKEIGYPLEKLSVDKPNDFVQLPTQAELQKWFRDNHKMDVFAKCGCGDRKLYDVRIYAKQDLTPGCLLHKMIESYEEILEEGLQEACKLIKSNK